MAMAIVDPTTKTALARALGLDTERLIKFELICTPNEIVTVVATYIAPGDLAARLVSEFHLGVTPVAGPGG